MTPAERVVVEAAVRWKQARDARFDSHHVERAAANGDLLLAVDALLAEHAGPQPALVEVTWAQVVEGDQIYRDASGRAMEPSQPNGFWREVTRSGPLKHSVPLRMRINAQGIPRPIQPLAAGKVWVKRGVTGKAVDVLGSVLWSGQNIPTPRGGMTGATIDETYEDEQ